eukprot:g213.t1
MSSSSRPFPSFLRLVKNQERKRREGQENIVKVRRIIWTQRPAESPLKTKTSSSEQTCLKHESKMAQS